MWRWWRWFWDTGEAGVDSPDGHGQTPLSYAAGMGSKRAVKFLLSFDAVNPNSKDNRGLTPLHHAVRYGHVAVMKLLLNTGSVDVNSLDIEGRTPLALTTELYGNTKEEAVQFLIPRNQKWQRPKAVAFRCKRRCCRVVRKLLKWIR